MTTCLTNKRSQKNTIPGDQKSLKGLTASSVFMLVFILWITLQPLFLGAQDVQRPNVIFILADDLGYGDLSCYGQKHFNTPNIDKLARQGMKFTNHYSGSPVCAPSRSALMTGLHSGHAHIRGNKEVRPEGQWPLPAEAYTLAEMFKSAGYKTGVFGKWGLGYPGSEGEPNRQGVDQFFGYNCQRLAHNYFPEYLWDNTEKVILEKNGGIAKGQYAPELIHKNALEFLDNHRDKPFFLFYPMIIPHAELVAPENYMAQYRGKFLPERSFDGIDAGEKGFRDGPYGSQPEAHAAFAAMIHLMDAQVGEITSKVAALGLDKNTLIIFSSDNGPHLEGGADPDYFDSNGILRGYKRDVYEGGIRVPLIARWSGVIKSGSVSEHVSAFWDFMPTFAELLGINIDQKIDGISFAPAMRGKDKDQRKHNHLYWEFHEQGGRRALRQGDWKIVQYDVEDPAAPFALYNLKQDPSERNDVSARFPGKVSELRTIMLAERIPSEDFKFGAERQ